MRIGICESGTSFLVRGPAVGRRGLWASAVAAVSRGMARCSDGGDVGKPLRPLSCHDDGARLVASCDAHAHCDPILT